MSEDERQGDGPEGGDNTGTFRRLEKELEREQGDMEEESCVKARERAEEVRQRQRSRYEQLAKQSSMQLEQGDMQVLMQFSSVIAKVNEAGQALNKLRERHGEELPPHIINGLRENLKETSTVMLKELHALRNGRQQKKYDKRCICRLCHSVFMVPLPPDGICDECRAATTNRSTRY